MPIGAQDFGFLRVIHEIRGLNPKRGKFLRVIRVIRGYLSVIREIRGLNSNSIPSTEFIPSKAEGLRTGNKKLEINPVLVIIITMNLMKQTRSWVSIPFFYCEINSAN